MACERHPDTVETRRCTGCAKVWCDACARSVGVSAHVICPECGHALHGYAPQVPAGDALMGAVRRAISTEGIATAGAMAVLYALGSSLYAIVLIYLATLVSYYFMITHHVGAGLPGLPGPSDTVDHWGDIVPRAIGGVLTAALGLLPIILWSVLVVEPTDPRISIGLLLVGQIYMPAVILAIAVTNSPWAALSPIAWVRVIARAPGPYVRFVGLWVFSVGIGLAWLRIVVELGDSIPALFVAAFVWNLFWFAQAALVGTYIRQNAEAFGWD